MVMVLNRFHAIVEAQNFSRENLRKGCFAALVTIVQCLKKRYFRHWEEPCTHEVTLPNWGRGLGTLVPTPRAPPGEKRERVGSGIDIIDYVTTTLLSMGLGTRLRPCTNFSMNFEP